MWWISQQGVMLLYLLLEALCYGPAGTMISGLNVIIIRISGRVCASNYQKGLQLLFGEVRGLCKVCYFFCPSGWHDIAPWTCLVTNMTLHVYVLVRLRFCQWAKIKTKTMLLTMCACVYIATTLSQQCASCHGSLKYQLPNMPI